MIPLRVSLATTLSVSLSVTGSQIQHVMPSAKFGIIRVLLSSQMSLQR